MVTVVRCKNPACKKYMMVESAVIGQTVACLVCKKAFVTETAPAKVPVAKLLPANDPFAAGDLRLR